MKIGTSIVGKSLTERSRFANRYGNSINIDINTIRYVEVPISESIMPLLSVRITGFILGIALVLGGPLVTFCFLPRVPLGFVLKKRKAIYILM